MPYEAIEVDTTTGTEDIVVDTLTDGSRIQIVRLDLGADTATQAVSTAVPVTAATLPLPSGASTSALQSTGNASLATIAGAVSGGQMQVSVAGSQQYTEAATDSTITGNAFMWEDTSDTLRAVSAAKPLPVNVISQAALPTGSNAIGKLAANDGVDIGNVDVASIVPGTTATSLGKAVDSPVGATDTGVAVLFARTDTLTTLTPAENDYTRARTDSMGRVWVRPDWFDGNGQQLTWDPIREVTTTPTIGTGACVQYDSLHTSVMTFSAVVTGNGKLGHVVGARLASKHNSFSGKIALYLARKSITGTTAQDALSISDTDALEMIGDPLIFDFSKANGGVSRTVAANRDNLPMPFKCDAGVDDLFGILQLWSADTPTFGASDLVPYILVQPE